MGLSVPELMKSERFTNENVSNATASEAITDSFELLEKQNQKKGRQMYYAVVIASRIIFAILTLICMGTMHIVEIVLFFSSVGGIIIGGREYLLEKDPEQKKIYGIAILMAYAISAGSGICLFGAIIELYIEIVIFVIYLQGLIKIFQNLDKKMSRGKFILSLWPRTFAFALCIVTVMRVAGST